MYTPLVTYKHEEGEERHRDRSPAWPRRSRSSTDGGKTYEFTLRKGTQVLSDGTPVKA